MKHIKTELNKHIMHQSQKDEEPKFFIYYIYKMDSKNILFKKAFIDNDHKERSKAFIRGELRD